MQLLQHRRDRARARSQVLQKLMQMGFTDGIQQISFNVESLGAERWFKGWFKGLDGITYRFEWRGNTLTYQQTSTTQPLLTHSVTLPSTRPLTKRLNTDQRNVLKTRVSDRSTFSCGVARSPRNRSCSISGVNVERTLKDLLKGF